MVWIDLCACILYVLFTHSRFCDTYPKELFLSSLVPFYEYELLSYNSRIYDSFQLFSSNKELFQVREGNLL